MQSTVRKLQTLQKILGNRSCIFIEYNYYLAIFKYFIIVLGKNNSQ